MLSTLATASALICGGAPRTAVSPRAAVTTMGLFDELKPPEMPKMPWDPVEASDDDAEASDEDAPKKPEAKISFEGLAQLITMGAGAPMLGELKKVNFNKSEGEGGAALQFELEANNFEDEKGNIKQGAYRDEGYVDPDYEDPMEALKKMWPFGGK